MVVLILVALSFPVGGTFLNDLPVTSACAKLVIWMDVQLHAGLNYGCISASATFKVVLLHLLASCT